ncbi:hypothetical protein [Mycoavidus sp. B2-EB]|uniref:hypothetical protein n=1 Tax=Mycoavidus sp. B2-EB TaxID=2651972 RepID=UPI0016275EFD|nr:hypothetical protein [Mycoavidus sp. B2-EB]BBO59787.1 hypothetical protein MPB2EB_0913 [Mycoavidus sp. B2-EB]
MGFLKGLERAFIRPAGEIARDFERAVIRPAGEVARDFERAVIRPAGEVARDFERAVIRPLGEILRNERQNVPITTKSDAEIIFDRVFQEARQTLESMQGTATTNAQDAAIVLLMKLRLIVDNFLNSLKSDENTPSDIDTQPARQEITRTIGDINELNLQIPSDDIDSLHLINNFNNVFNQVNILINSTKDTSEVRTPHSQREEAMASIKNSLREICEKLNIEFKENNPALMMSSIQESLNTPQDNFKELGGYFNEICEELKIHFEDPRLMEST